MKGFKKSFVAMLVLCIIMVSIGSVPASAAPNDGIMPIYNNTFTASFDINITDNGILEMNYSFDGYSGVTTQIVTTTYVEKKTWGIFWSRLDIGTTNNEWVDTINDYKYSKFRSHPLFSTGTYRVTVEYVAYGSGGDPDTIEFQPTDVY